MNLRKLELSVGAFVLAGLAAVTYFAVQSGIGKLLPVQTYSIKARFTNVGGLKPGSPVFIAGVAVDHQRDGLVVLPCGHLFGTNTTRLAVKRGAYLRGFVYSFIELLVPTWDRQKLTETFGT